MLIGYARVSTDDQNLDLQRDALRLAGCEKIYEDRMSGAKAARPGLTMALEVARAGDVLTVWRLDRLGRSLHDLIVLGRRLDEMGISLMSMAAEDLGYIGALLKQTLERRTVITCVRSYFRDRAQ